MKQTKERPGVMVYFHLTEPLTDLNDSQFGRLMRALLEYAQYGVVPQFDEQLLTILWGFFRHASDVDKERYDQRCASARAAVNKRWGKDTAEYDPEQTIPKTEENTQAQTKAAADAHTQAPAAADKQTETVSDPKTAADPTHPTPAPSQNMSPAWGKMMNALYRLEQDKQQEARKQVEDRELLDAVRRKRQEIGLPV